MGWKSLSSLLRCVIKHGFLLKWQIKIKLGSYSPVKRNKCILFESDATVIFSKWLLMPSQAPPLGIARQLQPARHLRTMLWELREHSRNAFRAVQARELGASSLLLFFLLSLSFSYSLSDAGRWWIPNQPLWSVKFQYYVSRTWTIEACFVWCKQ